jgi:hypothetical protein
MNKNEPYRKEEKNNFESRQARAREAAETTEVLDNAVSRAVGTGQFLMPMIDGSSCYDRGVGSSSLRRIFEAFLVSRYVVLHVSLSNGIQSPSNAR